MTLKAICLFIDDIRLNKVSHHEKLVDFQNNKKDIQKKNLNLKKITYGLYFSFHKKK